MAYEARLVGAVDPGLNDEGIWLDSTLVARMGSPAPGTSGNFDLPSLAVLNGSGQVAYMASLQHGGTVTGDNDLGIWIGDGAESLLVAREGDTLSGKIIEDLVAQVGSGGEDGRRTSLNDFGQLAYWIEFTDGAEGIFLFTLDLRWRTAASGGWDDKTNWTVGTPPAQVHDVTIDPAISLTVAGPTGPAAIRTLNVGGGAGIAILALNGGVIGSPNPVQIAPTGILAGDGVINADAINNGSINPNNITINGALSNFEDVNMADGRLVVSDSLINNGNITGPGYLESGGTFSITSTGRVSVPAGDTLVINAKIINQGRIEAINGNITFQDTLTNFFDAGEIFARNATLRFEAGLLTNSTIGFSFGTSDVFGSIRTTLPAASSSRAPRTLLSTTT